MSTRTKGPSRPAIVVTSEDHEKLSRMVAGASTTMPELAVELARELDRARILPEGRSSPDHVRIGSQVEYRDEVTGKVATVTLVWPQEADISQGKIAVMTPIGIALIGMAAGKSIDWTTRSGDVKRMTVLQVNEPAEPVSP